MKITNNLFCILLITLIYSASIAQNNLYLGQTPPDEYAKRFPPTNYLANSQWFWHGSPCFSPDGSEMYWVKYFTSTNKTQIWYSKYANNSWSSPKQAPFAESQYKTNNPYFRNSNDTLYFYSTKPGAFIYYVTRLDTIWSQPQPLTIPIPNGKTPGSQFSFANSETIYFELTNIGTSDTDLYYSVCLNGVYQVPINLGTSINSLVYDWSPLISGDEKTLFFSSNRDGGFGYNDIYCSKKNESGNWGTPINLTIRINGNSDDAFPYITPDNKYFFFTTAKASDNGYNPYWISINYINSLLTNVDDNSLLLNNFNLYQNFPNPFNPSTTIKFSLLTSDFVTLKVYDTLGKEITTLISEELNAGNHTKTFIASNISSGVYFYKLQAGKFSEIKKMVLMR